MRANVINKLFHDYDETLYFWDLDLDDDYQDIDSETWERIYNNPDDYRIVSIKEEDGNVYVKVENIHLDAICAITSENEESENYIDEWEYNNIHQSDFI